MDYISKKAKKFASPHIYVDMTNYEKAIRETKNQLYEIDDTLDKIKFINILLEANNAAFEIHKPKCKSPDNCQINYAHESVDYFLQQENKKLGVSFDQNTFTLEEKISTDFIIDQILKDLEEIKLGNQIIYDDLLNEIKELKDLYFLGKKNWKQLFIGKCSEMVAEGIISEAVSKRITSLIAPYFNKLL